MPLLLRDVHSDDLPVLFAHQADPESARMAAFPSRALDAFLVHWHTRVLADPEVRKQVIVVDGVVVGSVVAFDLRGRRTLGYWLGREFWGRGLATRAVSAFLDHERARPLFADVAAHNVGSQRVLLKCGFVLVDRVTAPDGVVDHVFRLDG